MRSDHRLSASNRKICGIDADREAHNGGKQGNKRNVRKATSAGVREGEGWERGLRRANEKKVWHRGLMGDGRSL
jgi:hypothetical protein